MSHLDDDLIAGLAALPTDERRALAPHLDECARCRARIDLDTDVLGQLDVWNVEPPSDDALERAERAVLELMTMSVSAPTSPRGWRFAIAALGAGVALAAIAKQHSPHAHDWVQAVSALGLATGLAYFASSTKRFGAIGLAVAASFGLALLGASLPGLSPAVGMKCFLFELATATVPGVVAWRAARRGELTTVALAAAAGALAGMAALHVACPVHEETAHLFVFHVSGVIVAATLGWLVDRRHPRVA